MTEGNTTLEAECRVFADYLLGIPAEPYVIEKYRNAHAGNLLGAGDSFGLFLVRVARQGRFLTRLADSYARLLAPKTLLRRKLILLLAILETAAPSSWAIDAGLQRTPVQVVGRLVWEGLTFSLSGAAAVVFLGPCHLALRLMPDHTK